MENTIRRDEKILARYTTEVIQGVIARSYGHGKRVAARMMLMAGATVTEAAQASGMSEEDVAFLLSGMLRGM